MSDSDTPVGATAVDAANRDGNDERQQLLQGDDLDYLQSNDAALELSSRMIRQPKPHRKRRLKIESLDMDDVEEQDIRVDMQMGETGTELVDSSSQIGKLLDEELLSFVGVYFRDEFMSLDAYHINHSTNPEINRHGK